MRRAPAIELTYDERRILEVWSRGRSTPARLVLRAKIVLAAAAGKQNQDIAINMAQGKVIGTCQQKHRHQEWIKFLQLIDEQTDPELDLHLIVDNYATHKHPKVKAWLKKHPQFHMHFIPTSSSWLNVVERWFRELTDKRIRRGTFQNVPQLIAAIQEFIDQHNSSSTPFVWTATADNILAKVARARAALDKTPSE